jgi:hypothetical protein
VRTCAGSHIAKSGARLKMTGALNAQKDGYISGTLNSVLKNVMTGSMKSILMKASA